MLRITCAHPEMCASLVVAGGGAGSTNLERFEQDVRTIAESLEKEGMKAVAEFYSQGPTRVQFRRPSIFALEARLKQLQVSYSPADRR